MEHANYRKIFVTAFFLHIAGSFLYCMVLQYYYGYGDSFGFYAGSNFLRKTILLDNGFFRTIFSVGEDFSKDGVLGRSATDLPVGIQTDSNLMVMKISALVSYLSFNSYLIISLFFSLFAFWGLWLLFNVFDDILDKKGGKLLAFAILYMPSVCFWGSGLMKDSLCLGMVGLIIYAVYNLLVKKEINIRELITAIFCFYFLFILKSYLASTIIISTVLAIVIQLIINSRGNVIKMAFVLLLVLVGVVFFSLSITSTVESIMEESQNQIEIFKGAYANASADDERSKASFTETDFDFSFSGIVLRSPSAISTTLFRPFLWESNKPIMWFSALESLMTLLFTLYIVVKSKVFGVFRNIFNDSFVFFSFTYVIVLASIIGFSTFNFGTLVRYRLPVLPFYYFLLIRIYFSQLERKALATTGN